jgi:protein-disulfide isomerase
MRIARWTLAVALSLSAAAVLAATNWLTTIDTRGGGHKIGNPAATVKLTEFVSYTCPSCGYFQQQAGSALDFYVATGKLQLDVRHVVRDPVDLTAAMLANCGPPAKFPLNHKAIMSSQGSWLRRANGANAAQQARWTSGAGASRRRAIASDVGFYELMETRGYERIAVDRCLADESLANRLAAQTKADDAKWDISGTPTFVLDGEKLGPVTWQALQRQIDAKLYPRQK